MNVQTLFTAIFGANDKHQPLGQASEIIATHDFEVSSGGTVHLLIPKTEAAHQWVKDHLPDIQPWQKVGEAISVEHRYIGDILEGIVEDGLTVRRQ